MLRITVHDNPESVTFQLEGRLAGPWVGEVEECRQRTLAHQRRLAVRFDLTGVTFIDDAGKAYLAAVHRQGAEFIAIDCLTRAIVAEITKAPPHPHPPPPVGEGREGGRSKKAKAKRN
jgi:ABC-type transporter Mla MlaB component